MNFCYASNVLKIYVCIHFHERFEICLSLPVTVVLVELAVHVCIVVAFVVVICITLQIAARSAVLLLYYSSYLYYLAF